MESLHAPLGSNVRPGLLSPDSQHSGQEVVRRQAEWEHEIETLDQKEMELHQSQLRLIREQTATFVRDVAVLQQDVAALKGDRAHSASFTERLDYVEKILGDSAEKHQHELEMAHGRLDKHFKELEATRAHHASVVERLGYVERLLGDSADTHARELRAAYSKLEQLHSKVSEQHGSLREGESHHASIQKRLDYLERFVGESAEKHIKELEAAKAAHAKLVGDTKARDAHHASVAQRLEYLEKAAGDSFEKHARELEAARGRLDQLHSRLGDHHTALTHHATLQERINYVEKVLGDSADKHAEDLAAAHSKLDQLRGRLSTCEAHGACIESLKKSHAGLISDKAKKEAHYSSMGERLDFLEKTIGDTAEKVTRDSATSAAKLDQLNGRIAACEKQAGVVGDLHKAHSNLASSGAELGHHHVALRERVDYLEGLFGSSADRHVKELEALKTAHSRLTVESKQREAHHASVTERLAFLEKLLNDSADKHAQELAGAHAQLEKMHGRLSSCEAQGGVLDSLKKSHATLSSEKATRDAYHATMVERVDFLERTIGDSADAHARELAAAHAKLDQMHGRLSTCEKQSATVGDLHKAHAGLAISKADLDAHHASVKERVAFLEELLGDSADKHAKDLEAVKVFHTKLANDAKMLDAHHASMGERLDFIEGALGESADKHARELAAAHAKLDQLHGRLVDDRASHEAHVRGLIGNEKDMRDAHHASLRERIDYLENLVGESADKHSKDLDALKNAQAKHTKEAKARETHQATLVERFENLEKSMAQFAEKHSEGLAVAHTKVDQLHGRLVSCEKQANSVSDLQKAHAGLTNDKALLDRHHSTLSQRVDFIEATFGESADKHSQQTRDVESVKAAHSKLMTEAKQMDVHHASLVDRLNYIEQLLGDSADKHAQELRAAHAKLDQMHARLAGCEAQSTAIDTLRKSHAQFASDRAARDTHHASLVERLDYLERFMGDSADKHSKELAAARSKLDQLHGRVSEERTAREAHHVAVEGLLSKEKHEQTHSTSMQDRLTHVEHLLGELCSKFADLREHVSSEAQRHTKHCDSVQEHLAVEKRAREAHERAVQNHLTGEKKARDVHEGLVSEQFGHEKAARERCHAHMQDMLGRERDAREKHHEAIQDQINRHTSVRDSCHKDLLAQERAERVRHHDAVNECVDSLQRTVTVFDSLIRKEMDERSRENRRIWDAIDNHTHDLSTQVITDSPGGLLPASGRVDDPASGGAGCGFSSMLLSGTETPPPRLLRAPAAAYSCPGALSQPAVAEPTTTTTLVPAQVRNISPAPCALRLTSPLRAPAVATATFGGIVSTSPSLVPVTVTPQVMPRMEPPSPHLLAQDCGTERVLCGHTRYGGEPHRVAELLMD